MRSKQLALGILAILAIIIILISGCTPNVANLKDSSTCPYAGTYKGSIRSSGEKTRWLPEGGAQTSPYLLNYDLEVTFKCVQLNPCEDNKKQCWYLLPTHAKVSDPYFGCQKGCTPNNNVASAGGTLYTWLPKPGESRVGILQIYFPNGNGLEVGPLSVDSDAKAIRADQFDHPKLISTSDVGFFPQSANAPQSIEEATFKCESPTCDYELQGVEVVLNKIS
jgi:hypothetical protein